MNSKSRSQAWIRLIVAAMLVSIYAAVWFTGGTVSAAPHLFYIPIILSALALSWTESLATAVISGILMSRWLMPLTRDPLVYQTTSNWILRLFILVSISLWTSLFFSFWERRSKAYQAQAQEFAQLYRASLHALVDLTELRDSDVTGRHINRLHHYTKLLTSYFNLREEQQNMIAWSIAFHDIGKVATPDRILKKPGPLTEEEWEIMKEHPLHGGKIIDSIAQSVKISDPFVHQYLKTTREIVLYHHEWYDGSGYPFGLKGEEIPFSARIAAVCDVYDSLRSKRPYKKPYTHAEAVAQILSECGTHFDPQICQAFEELADQFDRVWHEHSQEEQKIPNTA